MADTPLAQAAAAYCNIGERLAIHRVVCVIDEVGSLLDVGIGSEGTLTEHQGRTLARRHTYTPFLNDSCWTRDVL